jgi:hypothetical protein
MRFEDFEHFHVRTNDIVPPVLTHIEPCNTTIDDEIGDGTSVATLMRVADQHRTFCQYGFSEPEATAEANARWESVWLTYTDKPGAIAFLRRQKDTELWDVIFCGGDWDQRISGNGVGYEQGLALVFRIMGDQMPEDFAVSRESST